MYIDKSLPTFKGITGTAASYADRRKRNYDYRYRGYADQDTVIPLPGTKFRNKADNAMEVVAAFKERGAWGVGYLTVYVKYAVLPENQLKRAMKSDQTLDVIAGAKAADSGASVLKSMNPPAGYIVAKRKKQEATEPTLSDVLERIDKGFNDLTDFFKSAGFTYAEPTEQLEPEWEDLTVTCTLNKEQAIALWYRLNTPIGNIDTDNDMDLVRCTELPEDADLSEIFNRIEDHLIKYGICNEL